MAKVKNSKDWVSDYNKNHKEKVMMLADAFSDEKNGLNQHLNRDEWKGYFEEILANRDVLPNENQTNKLFDKSKENNYLGVVIESYLGNLIAEWKFSPEDLVNFEDSKAIVIKRAPHLPYASPGGLMYLVQKYGSTSPVLTHQRQLLHQNPR